MPAPKDDVLNKPAAAPDSVTDPNIGTTNCYGSLLFRRPRHRTMELATSPAVATELVDLSRVLPIRATADEYGLGDDDDHVRSTNGRSKSKATTYANSSANDASPPPERRRVSEDLLPASQESFAKKMSGKHGPSCVIQFATAVFFCDESEGSFHIDVMRIGPAHMPVTVTYTAIDGQAQAETNFLEPTGELYFAPGIIMRTANIPVRPSAVWTPSLDFSIQLSVAPDVTHARITCAHR